MPPPVMSASSSTESTRASPPATAPPNSCVLRAGLGIGRQKPPRDLGAQALGLLGGDRAAREVALDLGQLVAIDLHVEGFGRAVSRRPRITARARSAATASAMPAATIQKMVMLPPEEFLSDV